ncbi:MAG TPA: hypothetical protein PLR88_06150 [Bacteroidales bacterium]|nr:hypothetical protein [Bacteroidales bacterium]
MKKFAVLLIVAFAVAMVVSSCSQKECPAYSMNDTEQTNQNI